MNSEEITNTIRRYNVSLEEHGPTEKALGWGKKGRSQLRFEMLASRWDFRGRKIIDFGCGFGDMYGYLQRKEISVSSYLGIDINPNLLEIAVNRYPTASFMSLDLLKDESVPTCDFVVSSGVFNFELNDNLNFIDGCFNKFAEIASLGFAANFLSNKVESRIANAYHADPAEILSRAYQYSNNVVLRNDYMPFEFTVFVDKATKVDPQLTVYEDHLAMFE